MKMETLESKIYRGSKSSTYGKIIATQGNSKRIVKDLHLLGDKSFMNVLQEKSKFCEE